MRILFFLCLLLMGGRSMATGIDSQFAAADVVVTASISRIGGGSWGDLGTMQFPVVLHIHRIHKQTIPLDSPLATINWEVSNLHYHGAKLIDHIRQYDTGKWVFFLSKQHFMGGAQLGGVDCMPLDTAIEKSLARAEARSKIVVNHFFRDKRCTEGCKLCRHIKACDWKKVERGLARQAMGGGLKLGQHRQIKWAHGDRSILASMPSYMGVRLLLLTDSGEIPAYAHYQVGYSVSYSRWVPLLCRNLFRWNVYKYFHEEVMDTLILLHFLPHSNRMDAHIGYERTEYLRAITDTAWQGQYSPSMPLPDEYVLLAAIYDGPLSMYDDHYKALPNYEDLEREYMRKLAAEQKVYLLCFLALHTRPTIGVHALRQLQQLQDARCLPFLLALAQYRANNPYMGLDDTSLADAYLRQLITTLDHLTGCTTLINQFTDDPDYILLLQAGIPVWGRQLVGSSGG